MAGPPVVVDDISMLVPGSFIDDKWRIVTVLFESANSFLYGWYEVRNKETDILAFCEVQSPVFRIWKHPLLHKALVTKELTQLQLTSIAKFIEYQEVPASRYCYLITEPKGPSLKTLRESLPPNAESRFSLVTCLHIARESLLALKEFHEAGYIHRVLDTALLALNPLSKTGSLLLVLSGKMPTRRWRNFDDSGSIPPGPGPTRTTNWKYASINGNPQSRIDDVWSWFYMTVDLTNGSLPWTHQANQSVDAQKKNAHQKPHEWLNTAPEEYVEIFGLLSSMTDDEPDYDGLLRLLRKAIGRTVKELGGNVALDWQPVVDTSANYPRCSIEWQ